MIKKKILLSILITIGLLSLVAAAWYFIIGGNVRIDIASLGSYKEAIINFPILTLSTTEKASLNSSTIPFVYNREGNFSIDIIETIMDLSNGTCANPDSDCVMNYSLYDGGSWKVIKDNDLINIPLNTATKYISVNLTCVAYSCPQSRDISIRLNQVA